MRTLFFSLLTASAVLASSVARADDSAPTAPPPPAPSIAPPPAAPSTTWYGYQTLATDGVAVGLFALGAASHGSSSVPLDGALAVYGLGAPLVHLAHGRVGTGLGDLGLRVGMVALGTVVGYGLAWATYTPSPECGPSGSGGLGCIGEGFAAVVGGMVLGGTIGAAGGSAIDAIFLARESTSRPSSDDAAPAPRQPAPAPQATITRVRPTFGVAPERTGGTRATVGLVGTF